VNITIEKNVSVAMRDGVTLATDVYRPADGPPVPTLLQRHPYDKEHSPFRDQSVDVLRTVQQGYAVVTQDCRGTFGSEGQFRLFADEAGDGADTIEWVAAQPWSTGKVGMVGASYYGATQWLAAGQAPPALAAIAPHLSSPDFHGGWAYRGGAFELGFSLLWSLLVLGTGELLRRVAQERATVDELLAHLATADRIDRLYERLPLSDLPELGDLAPGHFDWLAHPSYDDFWRGAAPGPDHGAIAAPVLSLGGWHDIFLRGTLAGYEAMKAHGATAAARRPRLVVGPWAHGQVFGAFPERGFGVLGSAEGVDITGIQLRWFDRHLKGIDDGYDDEPPVKLFVMGPNVWRDEPDWPLPDTAYTDFYLHSGGHANTAAGDGGLSIEPPADEPHDAYRYNPRDPVPTVGGASFLPALFIGANSGPRDQAAVEARHDVLCFTTEPLARDLEVIGPVELVLHCSSSALDTDFTGKLVDVHPDGRAELVTDGILRARYRDSLAEPTLLQPGNVYELRIDLSATATVFPAGHRIRLEVASSNFPRFDRNTNTGGVIADEGPDAIVEAVNRVYHDRLRPSRLVLPIIDRR
jgi:putative CocE/NonD family hydrolase